MWFNSPPPLLFAATGVTFLRVSPPPDFYFYFLLTRIVVWDEFFTLNSSQKKELVLFTHNVINVGFHSNINIDNNITKRKKKYSYSLSACLLYRYLFQTLWKNLHNDLFLLLNMYLQTVLRLHLGTLWW